MLDTGIKVLFEGNNITRLLDGLWVTTRIALISVILSVFFGTIIGIGWSSRFRIIHIFARFYLEIMRIMPILVLLFLFYFGLTRIAHINLNAEMASIIVFTLWGAAEMSDLVRGALTSLPEHQKESGLALGLKSFDIYFYILVPQAIRRLLPATINLTTRIIKSTSLVVLIGVVELLKVGQQIIETASLLRNQTAAFWVYAIIFLLYFIICYPISQLSFHLEKKWQS